MVTTTLDIRTLRLSLDDVLALVRKGAAVLLTEGSVPLARLVPLAPPEAGRIPGLHNGSMEAADDFDASLPDDFWRNQRRSRPRS
ncbi:MAG: Antitoxin component of toxin-antitoxin stability system, DNA-binding transcriptional repressor [Candidatus Electronema aureum]|uniref:Antitoxin component of toxin-antitoxin stability system, DNA-binding transcriptional repressor n=1 Tax=Candidatus Electronema aureum TaxID=2005002 RepID=A0A521G2S5_9BACT|nr:MAG: Antitoxin component of toxin-antitoxin stability system, DNA-binding transcriptional repressor [Candidatus Electronema aureum]